MAAKPPTLTLTIPKSKDAPDGAVTSRQYIEEGDGFTLVFTLPYKRNDVYRELISEKQLGVDHSNIVIEVTKAPAGAALEKKLDATASSSEAAAIKAHAATAAGSSPLFVGCKRTVSFPDGKIVSELIELVEPSVIKWRQLSSNRDTNMLGREGGALPEVTIALDDMSDGTSVRMTYDFYQIVNKDGSVLDGPQMSKLLAAATQGWGADMRRRGYAPLDAAVGGSTPRDSTPRSTVLRAAGQMKADMDEEAKMKAEMLARAKASMGQ
eukprot:CAMPEP_0115855510 /NCGR_PEP_ID=MMETSP0287-20121206/14578_1 /TAXON_ID=412157 /ORGANISM="Chrysochromulina rotalis, Strain UIO044" /LENGTH=266 /DNA_ID=CAMNT_0003309663 /DNA_START=18 /DNA_END=818 /DNA_ORIENTATION=-